MSDSKVTKKLTLADLKSIKGASGAGGDEQQLNWKSMGSEVNNIKAIKGQEFPD